MLGVNTHTESEIRLEQAKEEVAREIMNKLREEGVAAILDGEGWWQALKDKKW